MAHLRLAVAQACRWPQTRPAVAVCGEAVWLSLFTRWVQNGRLIAPRRKQTNSSPTESPLLFQIDPHPGEETLTARGGIPLVVQAFRSLGLPQSVSEQVRVKERERGDDEATLGEGFVILNAAGANVRRILSAGAKMRGGRRCWATRCVRRRRRSFCMRFT